MKKLGMVSVLLGISACTTYNTDFECGAGQGVACKSVSQINEMQEEGKFEKAEPSSRTLSLETDHNEAKTSVIPYTPTYYSGRVKKSEEKVQRLWLAGFEDERGFYHGPKFVYTVIEPAQWVAEKWIEDRVR